MNNTPEPNYDEQFAIDKSIEEREDDTRTNGE